jgi:peptidoglycan L-alanyl-D-glutamate endopeptidase CwlK
VKNSRLLSDLRPETAAKAEEFLARCAAAGIDVIVTSTLRDNESQAALYAQGRTAPGPRVTNAKPGESFHNYGVAFDFCPIVNGKCQWNDAKLFARCGEIGEACGLEWAGRWKGFRELAHLQEPGLTIAALKSGA